VTSHPAPPAWRLPAGVTRALWDYTHADHIAEDYDDFFAENSLFAFDLSVLRRYLTTPGVLVDLGCGTGRLMLPFAQRGFQTVGVDLSLPMLEVTGRKADDALLHVDRVLANMVELGCFRDRVADYVILMFSTLGMIRGQKERGRVLAHARRILKSGGTFVVHVHSRWHNLFDPQARWWVARNTLASLVSRSTEAGDKTFAYRGIPNFFLHTFTRRELVRDLRRAGFEPVEIIPLDTVRRQRLQHRWWFGWLRANGWIVVCR
jgi:ubiquinone/menaquinone biosynthesis C-methylase UbiE